MQNEPMSVTPRGTRLPSKLTAIGREAMRKALIEEAVRAGWNLSVIAENLELATTGNVTRAMRHLGLEAELEQARVAGLVRRGTRRKSG